MLTRNVVTYPAGTGFKPMHIDRPTTTHGHHQEFLKHVYLELLYYLRGSMHLHLAFVIINMK